MPTKTRFQEKFEGERGDLPTIFEAGIWERTCARKPDGNVDLNPNYTAKVYVYKDKDEVELLEGVHVYNLDMVWYDSEGKIHPLLETYKGRKYSMHFKIGGNKDKDGKEHEFEHMVVSPMRVGEFDSPDFEGLHEAEQYLVDFGIKCEMFSDYEDPYIIKFLRNAPAAYSILTSPGAPWDQILANIYFLATAFLIDDHVDNDQLLGRILTFDEMTTVRDKLVEVLRGEKSPEEQEVDFHFPKLKPICHYLAYMMEVLLKKGATREIVDRFIVDMTGYIDGFTIAMNSDSIAFEKQDKSGAYRRAMKWIRYMDTGLMPCLSSQLIDYGNKLSRKIHEDLLYQELRKLCMKHVSLFNDLMSYKKEMKDGETCSNLYIRHQLEGRPLEVVFEEALVKVNTCTMDIIELEKFTLKLYKDDPDLQKAIHLMKANVIGHMLFYCYARRYRKRIQYDVVVHLEHEDWIDLVKKPLPGNVKL